MRIDDSTADHHSWLYEWGNELESGVRGPGDGEHDDA